MLQGPSYESILDSYFAHPFVELGTVANTKGVLQGIYSPALPSIAGCHGWEITIPVNQDENTRESCLCITGVYYWAPLPHGVFLIYTIVYKSIPSSHIYKYIIFLTFHILIALYSNGTHMVVSLYLIASRAFNRVSLQTFLLKTSICCGLLFNQNTWNMYVLRTGSFHE